MIHFCSVRGLEKCDSSRVVFKKLLLRDVDWLDNIKRNFKKKSTLRNKHLIFIQTFYPESCCRFFYNTMMLMHTSLVFLTIMVQIKDRNDFGLKSTFLQKCNIRTQKEECSLWMTLPFLKNGCVFIFSLAFEKKVAFVPNLFLKQNKKNTLRLNFSNSDPERIEEGIRRMAEGICEDWEQNHAL